MKNTFILTMALLMLTGFNSQSQQINTAKLDSFFTSISKHNKGMGSIAVSRNGKLIYSRATGFISMENDKTLPATADTRYRIGSITKMFTATMIFQLIEEKKLTLETRLAEYFPAMPNAKKITIRHLLTHHSGLHNFTSDEAYMEYMSQPKTQKQMLDIIKKGGVDFEPGAAAEYSNSNYVLLGYIIEKITGKTYKEELQQRITGKTGLAATYYGGKTDLAKSEAYSFGMEDGWKQGTETDLSIPHGAGAIVSTPTELTIFIHALFTGKLVSNSSVDTMKTMVHNFGMGMFEFPLGSRKSYGHTGSIDGFASMLVYFPDDSVAVAYCSNGQVYPNNSIVKGVLSIYYNRPFIIPEFKAFAYTAEELDALCGLYKSSDLPLDITITRSGNALMAQATGQSAFPMESSEKNIFSFDQAGIIMLFNPEAKSFIMSQGGQRYTYVRP